MRQYSTYAWWKFREFNEFPHLCQQRLKRSYSHATRYMAQFPNEAVIIMARFVSFISGAFAAVLVIATMFEEDLLHTFELSAGRSVFFYITIFGTIMAISRGMVPDENQILEPAEAFGQIIQDIHYMPNNWRDRTHTEEVRNEFSKFFELKIVLFLWEIASVLFVPYMLYFNLSKQAVEIIDFFRDFSVHVRHLGHICSFADFDFTKHRVHQFQHQNQDHNENFFAKEGKLEQSFLFFKASNPTWEPNADGSVFMSNIINRAHDSATGETLGTSEILTYPYQNHFNSRKTKRSSISQHVGFTGEPSEYMTASNQSAIGNNDSVFATGSSAPQSHHRNMARAIMGIANAIYDSNKPNF